MHSTQQNCPTTEESFRFYNTTHSPEKLRDFCGHSIGEIYGPFGEPNSSFSDEFSWVNSVNSPSSNEVVFGDNCADYSSLRNGSNYELSMRDLTELSSQVNPRDARKSSNDTRPRWENKWKSNRRSKSVDNGALFLKIFVPFSLFSRSKSCGTSGSSFLKVMPQPPTIAGAVYGVRKSGEDGVIVKNELNRLGRSNASRINRKIFSCYSFLTMKGSKDTSL